MDRQVAGAAAAAACCRMAWLASAAGQGAAHLLARPRSSPLGRRTAPAAARSAAPASAAAAREPPSDLMHPSARRPLGGVPGTSPRPARAPPRCRPPPTRCPRSAARSAARRPARCGAWPSRRPRGPLPGACSAARATPSTWAGEGRGGAGRGGAAPGGRPARRRCRDKGAHVPPPSSTRRWMCLRSPVGTPVTESVMPCAHIEGPVLIGPPRRSVSSTPKARAAASIQQEQTARTRTGRQEVENSGLLSARSPGSPPFCDTRCLAPRPRWPCSGSGRWPARTSRGCG